MTRLLISRSILATATLSAMSLFGGPIYNNLTPNNLMATASRPDAPGEFEIETGDDFVLSSQTSITSASLIGLFVPGTGGAPSISQVVVEIYRAFPEDSDTTRTPNVPTRANSPSDVAFAERSGSSQLSFTSSVLSNSLTALNSVQAGGIHPLPGQHTGGNGQVTGQEVQIDINFVIPFDLGADHYFFVPQVTLTDGAQFYWLSASRPISGIGTTPFAPDLQAWTRDDGLDPDWLRVGTDIVGGGTPPTFNMAFSLDGTTTPEPAAAALVGAGLLWIILRRRA